MLNKNSVYSGFVTAAKAKNCNLAVCPALNKIANILRTSDSINDIQNSLTRPIVLSDVLEHNLIHGLPYAGAGAGLGLALAKSNPQRKAYSALGAATGGTLGGAIDLVSLGQNERDEKLSTLLERLETLKPKRSLFSDNNEDGYQATLSALKRTSDDSWYDAFIPSN